MRTKLRLSLLVALLLTTSTGVVLASSTVCRVAVVEQLRQVRVAAHKRIHHSAATLARWKIGAAAWSKAHGGKVYAGAPMPRHTDWKPLTFTCDDVALDLSRPDEGLLLASEAAPEFSGYGAWMVSPVPELIQISSMGPQPETVQEADLLGGERLFSPTPFGGGIGAIGNSPDATVGPASFPPGPVPPVLAGPVPTPEPPTVTLLATGMLTFLISKLRRRTVV